MDLTLEDLQQTMLWVDLVEEHVKDTDIEVAVVLAIIYMESRGDPRAINERSGATGLMQIMPKEAGPMFKGRPTSEELLNPTVNVTWGLKILHYYMGKEGNLRSALYRYSGGNWPSHGHYVKRYWKPFSEVRKAIQLQLKRAKEGEHGRL